MIPGQDPNRRHLFTQVGSEEVNVEEVEVLKFLSDLFFKK